MLEENTSGDSMPRELPAEPNTKGRGEDQPGLPAAFSLKERRLFPLPFFACPSKKAGYSRVVQQRRNRIRRAVENKNEAIFALNWLADAWNHGATDDGPSPMQGQVMQRVDGLIEIQKPSGCIERPEEALKSLLKGGSPYDMATTSDSLASYQSELVSLPADIRGCPDLGDVLPHRDRQFLEEKAELMIKPPDEIEDALLVQPYWDPKLRFNKKAYFSLVRKLDSIGYFNYTINPRCKVGVFFVWKSSRTKLRMITDARRSNACFRDPPGVSLMTGEGLGRIEVVFEDATWTTHEMVDSVSTYIGLSDVRDCFHRMRVPGWLSRFFAWEAVPAHVVGLTGQIVDGKTLKHDDAVFPCAGSLCQGFSWSLYFAQRANEFLCQSISPLADAQLSNDRGGPIVMKIGKHARAQSHFYVYVDNLGVIGSDRKDVEVAMEGLQKCFNSLGLQLHATEISDGYVEALGCVLDGGSMQSRANPKRLWRIHHGIKALLSRGRCTGKTLEIIIGHCTFLGLLRRSSLSVFHSVYSFIHKNYFTVEKLWSSVVKELRCFMGLCFLLVQDWWRPWNRAVTSSDSSLSGFGISQAWWPVDVVADAGRQCERSRFRRMESHSARESALTAAGFHFDGQRWGPFDEGGLKRLAEAGWELVDNFREIPAFGLKREHWSPKCWGAWKHRENIGILEARTVLKAVKRFCLTRFGHDVRHLHLCDNLGVVLSIERSRSKSYKLLKIIRCISAFLFARNVSLSIRWVPSELNFSDEPSRLFDEEESKLLIDLIQSDDFGRVSSRVPLEHKHEQQTHPSVEPDTCRSSAAASAASQEEDKRVDTGCGSESTDWKINAEQKPHFGSCISSRWEVEGKEGDSLDSRISRGTQGSEEEHSKTLPGRGRFRSDREYFIRMGGRERRKEKAHIAKKEKAESAKVGDIWYDTGKARPEPSGSGKCVKEGERQLRFKVGRDPGDGKRSEGQHGRREGGRSDVGLPVQQEVSEWRRQSLRGLRDGCIDGQEAHVRKVRRSPSSKVVEKLEGMAKVVPISLEARLSVGSMVRSELANGMQWPPHKSYLQPYPAFDLSSSRSPPQTQKTGIGEAGCRCDRLLERCDKPHRDSGCVEGGGEGRFSASRFNLASVHRANPGENESGTEKGLGVGLRLRAVPAGVSTSLRGAADRSGAISSPSFRAVDRQGVKKQRVGGGEKAWGVAHAAERDEVRESRPSSSNMAKARCRPADGVQGSGATFRGHHPRPSLSAHQPTKMTCRSGYFADFFAGNGGVARAARAMGFSTREWEILHGDSSDLTRPSVLKKIRADINSGKLIAAMFAPPCSTFSTARDRTRVIRNRQHPWGFSDLPEYELQKIRLGNACFKATLKIIRWLDKHAVPWIVENPHSSKAWFLPEMQELISSQHTQVIVTDFCQFKKPWRKRTRLLGGNIDLCDFQRCEKICTGRKGLCSRTHKPHVHLTGSSSKGIPMTRLAQPYPAGLCHDLAHALLAPFRLVPH